MRSVDFQSLILRVKVLEFIFPKRLRDILKRQNWENENLFMIFAGGAMVRSSEGVEDLEHFEDRLGFILRILRVGR